MAKANKDHWKIPPDPAKITAPPGVHDCLSARFGTSMVNTVENHVDMVNRSCG